MIDNQRGAYFFITAAKTTTKYCLILLILLANTTRHNLVFALSRVWYNGSYTMAAKPIKSLELHYTMIQFLIIYLIFSIWVMIIVRLQYLELLLPYHITIKHVNRAIRLHTNHNSADCTRR